MDRDHELMHVENGPIGPTLLHFAFPVLLSQILQELYNVADCMVVGHFGGAYALAAVGVSGTMLSVLIKFFIGFSSGVSVVTSRLFGERSYDRLRKTMTSVFRMVIVLGSVFSLAGVLGAEWTLRKLSCPEEVLGSAALYLKICAAGLGAQMVYNTGSAILRSYGDTRSPFRFYLVSVLSNIGLDLLLATGLHLGVAGAAAATLISQWLLAVMILRHLFRLNENCALRLRGEGLSAGKLREVLHTGLPAGMQALFMSLSSILIQTGINHFGAHAMAGMTLYAKVEGVLYLPTFAYGIALTGFIGQNLGAGRLDRVEEAVHISLKTMAAVILPLSLLLTAASPVLLRVFTRDAMDIYFAREAILFNLPVYVVYAVNQVYLGAIKGLGDTSYPMICTLFCYSVFRVIWCAALIPVFESMRVVYLSYDVSFFLMTAMLIPMYRRRFRMAAGRTAQTRGDFAVL